MSKDGQDVHIDEMIRAFRKAGHEVIIAAPQAHTEADFGEDAGFIAWLKKSIPKFVYEILEFGYSFVAYRRLKKLYREHRPDFLYERYNVLLLAGPWFKKRFGLPYILEVNAPLVYERSRYDGMALKSFAAWTERKTWQEADYTLPVTNELAHFLRAEGVSEDRIRVIPNGINRDRFPRDLSGEAMREKHGLVGKTILGFTGFIRDWHGLPRVIDAIADQTDRDDLHFLVIGDGPARKELEAHAIKRGVADKLTLTGIVERDQVGGYVAAFDIALQPLVTDYASPLKLFEYMGLGRAIIAPDQPNIREVLSDEKNALLFDPSNDDYFKDAIKRLCQDAALRRQLGNAAAQSVEDEDYTWDGNARRVIEMAKEKIARD